MAFAVVGIQAHFSKTLLLFFIPQIFNFLLSCPQLFGLVPCPRHRVPRWAEPRSCNAVAQAHHRFDPNTNLLHPSKTMFERGPPSKISALVLRTLSTLGLTELTVHPNTGNILEANNLTILNYFLLRLGPMNEKSLVKVLILSQVSHMILLHFVLLICCLLRLPEAFSRFSWDMASLDLCMMAIEDSQVNICMVFHLEINLNYFWGYRSSDLFQ